MHVPLDTSAGGELASVKHISRTLENMQRPPALSQFLRVVCDSILAKTAESGRHYATAQRMVSALQNSVGETGNNAPTVLAACRYLDVALDNARGGPPRISALADAFRALAPALSWQRRAGSELHGPVFNDGHANTYVVGPNGMERRSDVIVGATLLAPNVVYPDHSHPPEEIYLVMSKGEWFETDANWYTPGMGGIVHHMPMVTHAMRSGSDPLFAVWCLWSGASPTSSSHP